MWMSGTSFAAPLVSAAAASILVRHPSWTPDQVKGALMVSAATPGQYTAPGALGVGIATVSLWVARARGQRMDRVDWSDQSSIPHTTQRTDSSTEELVLAVRKELAQAVGQWPPRPLP